MSTGTPVTEDEIITTAKMNLKLETIGDEAGLTMRWARPGKLVAADGITLKHIQHLALSYAAPGENGDRYQMFFNAEGNETKLCISTNKTSNRGIWDLYVNGILDSSGYDDYNATSLDTHRYITLTQPIKKGYNRITLRVNGKNALSSSYVVATYGASLQ